MLSKMIGLYGISLLGVATANEIQGEPLVPFVAGEKFTVAISSCGEDAEEDFEDKIVLTWTDKCQPDPFNVESDSLQVSCSDEIPGAIRVNVFDGTCDEGELDWSNHIVNGECTEGQRYEVSQWVVDKCNGEEQADCCRTMSHGGATWADEECRKSKDEESCLNDGAHKCGWGQTWQGTAIEGCADKKPECCRTMSHGGANWADVECRKSTDEESCLNDGAHKCGWGQTWQGTAIEGCGDEPEPTHKPTKAVPEPVENVKCYSVGDPHFLYFDGSHQDFQDRGEFTLWETDGLKVQVRQGPFLTHPQITHVSTNNGFAIEGTQTCDNLFEIFAENGGSMKVTEQNGQVTMYTGVANIMTGLTNYNCPSISTNVANAIQDRGHNRNSPVAEFVLDNSRIRIQIESYGINIWVEVEGAFYLADDSGICTKREGGFDQLECEDSLFTVYPPGECPELERRVVEAKTLDDCPKDLREAAEQKCKTCPDIIDPNDCVLEVCALNDIQAAEKLLEACDIAEEIAPKKDVHCSSVGDPHFRYFDGTYRDFQDRGEFTLYETKKVKVQTRQGARPDLPNLDTISTNHAVAIKGEWTCDHKFEFFYDGPMLKVTKSNGDVIEKTGNSDIFSLLDTFECPNLAVSGTVSEFSLGEGAVRVRVQLQWYGINVWVDVKGPHYLDTDSGICTKREGAFEQLSCRKSLFTVYKEGDECESIDRKVIPLAPVECDSELEAKAKEICDACPDVVNPADCVMEACTIGKIEAATDLVKACEGGKTIIPDEPTGLPAPKPDVTCASLGDPHMKYFDGTGNDFQDRGEFTLYKNNDVKVQVRQGTWIGLPTTHPAYNLVSTNNAFAIEGAWTCGAKYEVYATTQEMIVTPAGGSATKSSGVANILAAVVNANCPTVNVAAGNIVEFSMANKMRLRFQLNTWGLHIWIDLKGDAYLDTDTGICTKREGAFEPIGCDESIFTEYPDEDCEKVEVKKIEAKDVQCDPQLEAEAKAICSQCPDVVSPKDCVFEACAMDDIAAAKSMVGACKIDQPIHIEECGEFGKIAKRGAENLKSKLKKLLKGKTVDSACACASACQQVGGTEWHYKMKNGKCGCFKGAKKLSTGNKFKKSKVGALPGSVAVVENKDN